MKVRTLSLHDYDLKMIHLPAELGSLINLEELGISCLENLTDLPKEIGSLKKLTELSLYSNGGVKLPKSLSKLKGLKVFMGNNCLKQKDQNQLCRLFPDIIFSFENEFDDDSANEEKP